MRKLAVLTAVGLGTIVLASACGGGGEEVPPAHTASTAPTAPTGRPTAPSSSAVVPTPSGPATGRIVFASDRDGNIEVYIMNADGSSQTRLTNNPAEDGLPDWSPVP